MLHKQCKRVWNLMWSDDTFNAKIKQPAVYRKSRCVSQMYSLLMCNKIISVMTSDSRWNVIIIPYCLIYLPLGRISRNSSFIQVLLLSLCSLYWFCLSHLLYRQTVLFVRYPVSKDHRDRYLTFYTRRDKFPPPMKSFFHLLFNALIRSASSPMVILKPSNRSIYPATFYSVLPTDNSITTSIRRHRPIHWPLTPFNQWSNSIPFPPMTSSIDCEVNMASIYLTNCN